MLRAIILALGLLAAPLQAAENLDCALKLNDDAVEIAVFKAYRAGENIGEALMAERGQGFIQCASANKWSDGARESAVRVIFGNILTAGIAKEMADMNLPIVRLSATLDGYLGALTSDQQQSIAAGNIEEAIVTPLLDTLISSGVLTQASLTQAVGGKIGEYLSAAANARYYRAEFARQ